MEATVDVDENDVVLISIGDTAKIHVDAFQDKTFMGIVTQIGNSAVTKGTGTVADANTLPAPIRSVDSL